MPAGSCTGRNSIAALSAMAAPFSVPVTIAESATGIISTAASIEPSGFCFAVSARSVAV
jgi:hypothetical protein